MSAFKCLISIFLALAALVCAVTVATPPEGAALAGHDSALGFAEQTEGKPDILVCCKGKIHFGSEQTPSEPVTGS
jgi:hypothetical protein